MRTIGYCTVCHKIRPVRVRDVDLAMAWIRRGIPVGVCAQCEEKDHDRAR